MLRKEDFRLLSALPQLIPLVTEESAGLGQNAVFDSKIKQISFFADATIVDDIKLGLPKWRGDLVLHNFHSNAVPDDFLPCIILLCNLLDSANIKAD